MRVSHACCHASIVNRSLVFCSGVDGWTRSKHQLNKFVYSNVPICF